MTTRRKFIKQSALASAFVITGMPKARSEEMSMTGSIKKPIVISTWEHGLAANETAWKILTSGGKALDAVEKGVMVSEADPNVTSVGYGGLPDRDGNVTLDACIMDEKGNCGSVAFLQNIMHPISVARLVMEKTPHIMLVGEGAQRFAKMVGFQEVNLLTGESKRAWEMWLKENKYEPIKIDKDNHDTIGMVAMDKNGDISGACTTSGLAWKYHGRVGDSPIIGAGMYADNEVGAACATGKGEEVIRICGAHLIVELMRNGKSPQQACEEAVKRIAKKRDVYKDPFQVGFLAINKKGEHGAYCIQKGFKYALAVDGVNKIYDSDFYVK